MTFTCLICHSGMGGGGGGEGGGRGGGVVAGRGGCVVRQHGVGSGSPITMLNDNL